MIYQKTYKVFNSFEGVRFNSNETIFKLLSIDKNDKIDFETGKIIKKCILFTSMVFKIKTIII